MIYALENWVAQKYFKEQGQAGKLNNFIHCYAKLSDHSAELPDDDDNLSISFEVF